jgi:hypothetical protein
MALMLGEVYDALLEAGASEEKSRKAAEAIASYDNRLAAIERKLEVHTYMLSTLIVIGLGILWRVLR